MLSLIVPVRDWPLERIEFCIDSFAALGSRTLTEIVVVDFGSSEPVALRPRDGRPAVRVVRVEAGTWSLAEAINVGVLSAGCEFLAKTDADILAGPAGRAAFDAVVQGLAAGEFGLAVSQAVDLDRTLGPAEAAAAVAAGDRRLGRLRAKWGQGGLVFFSRETWQRLGGFDSRFTGWGNEDNDFAERVRRAGQRLHWIDRDALSIFHVWHPPSYAATGVLSRRQNNQKIAREDKSIFRSVAFRHSNFARIAAPAVLRALPPLVTLGVATTARPNRDRMITEAINSFRGQIDNDFEILVLDNGSPAADTLRLRDQLKRIKWTDRIRVEYSEEGSIPRARNVISQLARGRFLCVVDDDDIALPNRLEDHLSVFRDDGNLHGSHGGWIDFDESTGVIERNPGKERSIATLLKGTGKITAHPASLYRTDVMRAVPYDEAFVLGSDFDLALRTANLGFEVRHTHSYLTLRRYHSANVTITGQSNQVSNGLAARARTLTSFPWSRVPALEAAAKKDNAEVYCRNQMSIDSLAELIPGYSGSWQIYVPVAALAADAGRPARPLLEQPVPALAGASEAERQDLVALLEDVDVAASPVLAPAADPAGGGSLLEALLGIVEGSLVCKRSGLNQPVQFRSKAISGLKRARAVRARIEALVNVPVQLNSVRQGELDRQPPFDWKAIEVKPGERVLLSERFGRLEDLLAATARLDPASLLRKAVSIISDFDEDGEAYYMTTPAIKGYEELQTLRFELERRTGIRFRHVASSGVQSELTLSARSH